MKFVASNPGGAGGDNKDEVGRLVDKRWRKTRSPGRRGTIVTLASISTTARLCAFDVTQQLS